MDWYLLRMPSEKSQSGDISWWSRVILEDIHKFMLAEFERLAFGLASLTLTGWNYLFREYDSMTIKDHTGTRLNNEKARACRKCGCAFAAIQGCTAWQRLQRCQRHLFCCTGESKTSRPRPRTLRLSEYLQKREVQARNMSAWQCVYSQQWLL